MSIQSSKNLSISTLEPFRNVLCNHRGNIPRTLSTLRFLLSTFNFGNHSVWITRGVGGYVYLAYGNKAPLQYLLDGGRVSDFCLNPCPKKVSDLKLKSVCVSVLNQINTLLQTDALIIDSLIDVEINEPQYLVNQFHSQLLH